MRRAFWIVVLASFVAVPLLAPPRASAQIAVGISVRIGPPPLRVLAVQPMAPGPGYLWTPGYWAYGQAGYYWVPGAWVLAPQPGLLWTPGYWGYAGGVYVWHPGYWGPRVGFYGGINYGFGYFGTGFVGGRWNRGHFYYNTAVWHVNRNVIHTTYVDRTVIRNVRVNHVSYNGGPAGARARASREEMTYARQRHEAPTPAQSRRQERARGNREARAPRGGNQAHADHGKANHEKHEKKKGDHRGPGGW